LIVFYIKKYLFHRNVITHQKLSECFIGKYSDKLYWYYISRYQKLSEGFIEKYINKVDWYGILLYQKLLEGFIKKYNNKIIKWTAKKTQGFSRW